MPCCPLLRLTALIEIMIMENAALNAIRAYLDPGESAVGTAVNVRHLAAKPVGRLVSGEAEVTRDVHVPTTDGRELLLTRYTEPDAELRLLLDKLKLALPAQSPPKITTAPIAPQPPP